MIIAITRDVSSSLARCELLFVPRKELNYQKARLQHRQYEDCLGDLGCFILRMPGASDLPDSAFVEDTCVVLDEVAIVARPGVQERRSETQLVSEILRRFRTVQSIEAPGTLDGGDVVRMGKKVFVGMSSRTNRAGVDQLETHLVPHGYTVNRVELAGCLHLKTAATPVMDGTLLVNRSWVAPAAFGGMRTIEVHPTEPFGANALLVDGTVIHSTAHPRTRERLEKNGIQVRSVEFSELEKAEAGVTCCCVLLNV